eukprot:scaffold4229_cov30-Tisochrysis_lutea.AAC.4
MEALVRAPRIAAICARLTSAALSVRPLVRAIAAVSAVPTPRAPSHLPTVAIISVLGASMVSREASGTKRAQTASHPFCAADAHSAMSDESLAHATASSSARPAAGAGRQWGECKTAATAAEGGAMASAARASAKATRCADPSCVPLPEAPMRPIAAAVAPTGSSFIRRALMAAAAATGEDVSAGASTSDSELPALAGRMAVDGNASSSTGMQRSVASVERFIPLTMAGSTCFMTSSTPISALHNSGANAFTALEGLSS